MGIVFKQSLKNTLITYLGFGIGAVNHLFLFTRFLTAEYFGLVTVILSASAVLMPIMAFGVPNTLVKYYTSFKDSKQLNAFLTPNAFYSFHFDFTTLGYFLFRSRYHRRFFV